MQLVSQTLFHWIMIYPEDSDIQLLNNWGQVTCYINHNLRTIKTEKPGLQTVIIQILSEKGGLKDLIHVCIMTLAPFTPKL